MKIDADLVLHIAHLGRLSLTEVEVAAFGHQIGAILDYVSLLETMPDELGPDWRHDTIGQGTPERLDAPQESLPINLVFQSTPAPAESYFQVPRILD